MNKMAVVQYYITLQTSSCFFDLTNVGLLVIVFKPDIDLPSKFSSTDCISFSLIGLLNKF